MRFCDYTVIPTLPLDELQELRALAGRLMQALRVMFFTTLMAQGRGKVETGEEREAWCMRLLKHAGLRDDDMDEGLETSLVTVVRELIATPLDVRAADAAIERAYNAISTYRELAQGSLMMRGELDWPGRLSLVERASSIPEVEECDRSSARRQLGRYF